LRWPESAALVEYAFPRLLTTPKRDAAIAVTVTRFRSGVPFSVRPPSLSLRHEEGFLIFARRSAGANRRKAPGLLLRPSHCWCASVAGPENPTPTRVRRRSRSGRRKPRNNETLDHLLSVVDPASVHAIRAPLQAIPNR
jgi:hypothetical protein